MPRKLPTLLLSIVLLATAVASRADTTYIPTFSDGKYRGCTRYDNGEPTVTFLKVSLLSCVVAGFLSTQATATSVPPAASADRKAALEQLPLDDQARFAKMLAEARKELALAADGANNDAARFKRASATAAPAGAASLRAKLRAERAKK